MLVIQITTLVIAFIGTFFGGVLMRALNGEKKLRKIGVPFLVLSTVLATVLITCTCLGIGGIGHPLMLSVFFIIALVFFIVDTRFIIDGSYKEMHEDDYIFGAMKLYADFILIFTLLMQLCE